LVLIGTLEIVIQGGDKKTAELLKDIMVTATPWL